MRSVFVFILLIFSGSCFSQEFYEESNVHGPDVRLILKTNPFAAIQGPIYMTSEFRLCAERMISQKQSLQFSASYLGKSYFVLLAESADNSSYRFVVRGMRFTAEYRMFIGSEKNKKAPEGFYVAPFMSYSNAKISDDYSITFNEYIKATYQNYCLKAGYQFIKERFALDIFIGGGYRMNTWSEHENFKFSLLDNKDMEPFPGNFKVLAGFNAGICF